MSTEESKAVVKRHVQGWINKNPTVAIDELVAHDMVAHDPDGRVNSNGFEDFKQYFPKQLKEYPDRTYTIKKLIAEGDEVAAYLDYRYTDPATGKLMGTSGVNIYRVSAGKICEFWNIWQPEQPI